MYSIERDERLFKRNIVGMPLRFLVALVAKKEIYTFQAYIHLPVR